MSELPRGWVAAPLHLLVRTKSGNSKLIKGRLSSSPEPGLVPAYSASGQDIWCDAAEWHGEGIVLSAVGARCGKAFFASGSWTAIANTHVIVPHDEIESKFLWYRFNDERFWVKSGSAQPFVKVRDSLEKTLLLPPLAEQRRIVAAIEEHFSRLDAAEEALCRADKRLTALKLSALQTAIDGNWPEKPLGDLLTTLRNGVFASRPSIEPPGIPIFRISAVRSLSLDVSDLRFADLPPEAASGYYVQEGDLLFTRYSGNPDYVGACAVVPHLEQPVLHPDKLIRVIVDRSKADPKFLVLALSIGKARRAIEERRKTTAGQVGIAGGQLKTVPVSVPPLADQRRIVAEVERQLSLVDALAAATAAALKRSAALRRSILERAFTGKLVPQDPTDEPASVLLERIRAERAADGASRKTRRSRSSS